MLVAGTMLLTIRNWASWSGGPFIMGHVNELSLVIYTKILSIAVLFYAGVKTVSPSKG
jgi:hypothetical protein